ncbi:hypothetical protein KP509_08G031300 [Ceratopteris richardii]|uniref:TIR domain-containing protein n=1 Tax=Ceratopteris richardii TaxID=49495 RepID=A0A8T2U4M5_CERRI|nr:hypothetical protein KP509_08G031300 [Ceratopteris richardii]
MMSQEYDVFICHRGPETKRNVVSVLSGMLRSSGATCFVDYRMDMGRHVESEIDATIQSSRVFIVVLSPDFATSKWFLDEIVKIMSIQDTQRSAVSVLRGILLSKGITPFVVDYGKTDGAESELNSDIVKAIENCRVHVIFLSENFVRSKWCLEEVAYIMNIQGSPGTFDASRKPTVLPIFYDVEPSTVRFQKANYDLNEVPGSSEEERSGWATALCELSKLRGLEYKTASTVDEDKFRSMVHTVVRMLNERHEEIIKSAVDFPVGLAQRSKEIERSILDCASKSEESLQCFGLLGMGGVGKTTLALSIYNKLHSEFEGSFLSLNTRSEVSEGKGVVAVQKKILANLLKWREDVWIKDELHGRDVLSKTLRNTKALVVLDDVDDRGHLDALYRPLRSSLNPRSVVIITTRERKILEWAKSTETFVLERLSKDMSKSLFYWHAFMRPKPPVDLEEVSESVIEACDGLPLALKVVGSHFYNKNDKSYWKESFMYLQKNRKDVFDVLRISFDGLQQNEQEVFLDICCFLIDEGEDLACAVLEACYETGRPYLDELENKCLITRYVDKDDGVRRIRVQDQLRDMGREIVRQERRDRVWDEQTASDILRVELCVRNMQTITLMERCERMGGDVRHCGHFRRLPQLRILVVNGSWCSERSFMYRWLRWERAPFQELPHGLCSPNIGVMELHLSDIRILRMASFPKLQHLDLRACRDLRRLDSSNGGPADLKYLNLGWCQIIDWLPEDIRSK